MSHKIGVDHFSDHFFKRDRWFPTQLYPCLLRIAEQKIHLGGANQILSYRDVILVVETDVIKGQPAELPD